MNETTSASPASGVRRKRARTVMFTLGVTALATVATVLSVGSPVAAAHTSSGFLACMVTDTGGINDHSFNASAWQGMQEAKAG